MAATSLTLNYADVLSTTLMKWWKKGEIPDQIFKGLTWFKYLDKRVEKVSGGERIQIPIMYGTNPTAKSYRHFDLLDMTPSEPFTSAFYDWKQLAVGIFISGLEMRANNGPEAIFNLFKARYNNAVMSIQKVLNDMLWSDGTGNSGKDFLGNQAIVSTSPSSGVLGSIDRSSNSFWRNQADTVGSFEANGIKKLRSMWVAVSNNIPMGKPTVHMMDPATYNRYENTIQPLERFTRSGGGGGQAGDAAFGSLTWKQAPCEWDDAAPANAWYMENTNVLHFVVHQDAYWKPTGRERPVDQDAYSEHLLLMGELCCSAPRHLGVLSGITD